MSTNYYWVTEGEPCKCCGQPVKEKIHIGKSSVGWVFLLHLHDELDIRGLDDWVQRFCMTDAHIEDEYGKVISPLTMLLLIVTRRPKNAAIRMSEQELRVTRAEYGAHGLLQSIDLVHGSDGATYDITYQDFS